MINLIVKNENKQKLDVENLLNDIYLLPKWEKIKSFSLTKNILFFRNNLVTVNLFRKFSSRNLLEKYLIKSQDDKNLANMDLKIYKDSVYIINLDIKTQTNAEQLLDCMIQVAVEKALYNTTEKEVFINLQSNFFKQNKIRKFLINNEFVSSENQSSYEKEMFGESYSIKVDNNSLWMKKIKLMPILINK